MSQGDDVLSGEQRHRETRERERERKGGREGGRERPETIERPENAIWREREGENTKTTKELRSIMVYRMHINALGLHVNAAKGRETSATLRCWLL